MSETMQLILVGIAVAIAIWGIIRQLRPRSKGKSCCDPNKTECNCEEHKSSAIDDECGGCPLKSTCKHN